MRTEAVRPVDRARAGIQPDTGIALVRGQYYIYRMRTCGLTHPHIARATFKKKQEISFTPHFISIITS